MRYQKEEPMTEKRYQTAAWYDIFGDIHGQADKLEELLLKLGYAMTDGVYQHPERKPVFVGDLIDGGTQNRRVIEVIRPMVNLGHAHAVMGNHEYNAICYHTRKSATNWLRPHNQSKFHQHEKFLQEYPLGHDDTNEVIEWFKTLPMFMEFSNFRVIHACWDENAIKLAQERYLNSDNTLNMDYLAASASKGEPLFTTIERLLKGVEVKLPDPYFFKDRYDKQRRHIRVKWWEQQGESYRDLAFGYTKTDDFPDNEFPDDSEIPFYGQENKPVFFGHYWMTGTPKPQQENVCCVDYSAGKGGKLVCYSFKATGTSTAARMRVENFRWVAHTRGEQMTAD